MTRRPLSIDKKLWSKVDKTSSADGCWLWTGYQEADGRGRILVNGRREMVYRVAWTEIIGPIPDGLWVCHKCDNPSCVNPAHLFLGTAKDNTQDMLAKGRHRTDEEKRVANLQRGDQHWLRRNPEKRRRGTQLAWTQLTVADVRSIRQLRGDGLSLSKIASQFNTTTANVHSIVTFRTWRHI